MAFVGFHHRHRRPTTDKDRQFGIVDSVGSVGFQLADVRKKRNRRIAPAGSILKSRFWLGVRFLLASAIVVGRGWWFVECAFPPHPHRDIKPRNRPEFALFDGVLGTGCT